MMTELKNRNSLPYLSRQRKRLNAGLPLFDVDRDDDSAPEVMKELCEWNVEKKKAKLEKVNDPSARKLLMKILSKTPSERYQSMDELLRYLYFGSGNKSSFATPKSGLVGFTIPITIGVTESSAVQQQIQNLVPTDFDGFYPEVIISYATGRRPANDVEGSGPGLYIAAEVIKKLFAVRSLAFLA
jgi:serine/threonine protein kinase